MIQAIGIVSGHHQQVGSTHQCPSVQQQASGVEHLVHPAQPSGVRACPEPLAYYRSICLCSFQFCICAFFRPRTVRPCWPRQSVLPVSAESRTVSSQSFFQICTADSPGLDCRLSGVRTADSPGLIHIQSAPVQSRLFSLVSPHAHFRWFSFVPLYFLVITGGT